ncbi:hypothetical protein V502_00465 [Pseudogymnoascus sp. VKM F-4520 (FW-2644)]|nr:hypothetical protein V502_00465 [Pseudogymnoascus sp. VKM F-4520 (FW-2644)]
MPPKKVDTAAEGAAETAASGMRSDDVLFLIDCLQHTTGGQVQKYGLPLATSAAKGGAKIGEGADGNNDVAIGTQPSPVKRTPKKNAARKAPYKIAKREETPLQSPSDNNICHIVTKTIWQIWSTATTTLSDLFKHLLASGLGANFGLLEADICNSGISDFPTNSVRFLDSCHSAKVGASPAFILKTKYLRQAQVNSSVVDFTEVAKECQVVSKGAAAKRYERMMRAHGIHPNGGPGRAPTARQPKTERNAGPSPTKKPKGKAAAFDESMNVDDDEEPAGSDNFKAENSQDEELLVIKSEQFYDVQDLQED